jgi:hypothetical protein
MLGFSPGPSEFSPLWRSPLGHRWWPEPVKPTVVEGAAEVRTSQVVAVVELISAAAAAATPRPRAMRISPVAAGVSRVVVALPTLVALTTAAWSRTILLTTRRLLTTFTVATPLAAGASSHVPAAVMAEVARAMVILAS